MLRKHLNYNRLRTEVAAEPAQILESRGHVLLEQVLDPDMVRRVKEDVDRVFREYPPDGRASALEPPRAPMFRYEMFNRSALVQEIIGNRRVMDSVEPLLGEDCHVIANTAWRNPPDREYAPDGQQWHVDGGPYVVRPPEVPWPADIPYPIFVVTAQFYLEPVTLDDGPTAVLPGSHRSGRLPPCERTWDLNLEYEGRGAEVHVASPGDVTLFVSDTWHRRMPQSEHTTGREFVQCAYARREIAQRILPTDRCCAANEQARERAKTLRDRQLIGLHAPCFYDG